MKGHPIKEIEPNKLGIPENKRVPSGVLKEPRHAHDIRKAKQAGNAETMHHLARKHGGCI